MAKKEDNALYLVKIQLKDAKPPIWRRLVVPRTITLEQFDEIVKDTMGWAGYHLSMFEVGNKQYKEYDEDDDFWDEDCLDYSKYRLCDVLHIANKSINYIYDFGDYWEHKITLEDDHYQPPKPLPQPLWCIKGKNACPLEDSGGIWGYMDLLKIIKDPQHEKYADMREWLQDFGYESIDDFAPTEFDIDFVNRNLEVIWEEIKNSKPKLAKPVQPKPKVDQQVQLKNMKSIIEALERYMKENK